VKYEIADAFKDGHAELQSRLGNPFIAFDPTGLMLPSGFYGLAKDDSFSNYTNRTITTDYDVSFLQNDFSIAHSGEPESRMRVWKIEGRYIQGQRIGTRIYTTSLAAQAQLVMTSNGIFAI
jgi:hypothetical protein